MPVNAAGARPRHGVTRTFGVRLGRAALLERCRDGCLPQRTLLPTGQAQACTTTPRDRTPGRPRTGAYLVTPVAAPGGRLLGVWNAWFRPMPPSSRGGDCETTDGMELTGRTLASAGAGGAPVGGALQAAVTRTPAIIIRTVIMPHLPLSCLMVAAAAAAAARDCRHGQSVIGILTLAQSRASAAKTEGGALTPPGASGASAIEGGQRPGGPARGRPHIRPPAYAQTSQCVGERPAACRAGQQGRPAG